MTTGKWMILIGIILLAVTGILFIYFRIKRLRYIPEAYLGSDEYNGATVRIQNGYPTDIVTKKYPPSGQMTKQRLDNQTDAKQRQSAENDLTEILKD